MKPALLLFAITFFMISCGKRNDFNPRNFNSVAIETILQDSLLNVRALEIYDPEKTGVFATSDGRFGAFSTETDKSSVAYQIIYDSLVPNFRSLALTSKGSFLLNISSPALLFKVNMDTHSLKYQETHPKAFYDSMAFWNDNEGIAIGDSTDGCLSVIITRDGGNTWTKLTCDQLPKGAENEGAFAASDTNIAIVGNKTWVATTAGRVYFSADKGNTWQVFDTPIVKAKDTEGIYSIDFYDALNGFAIGGDFTKPDDNAANKIKTTNGGKTWQLVAQNQNPGYRSCVQYIPNSNAKELVAVGFKGIDFSNDAGETWKHLSNEGFYTIRFLNDSVAYAAGAGRVSKLTFKQIAPR